MAVAISFTMSDIIIIFPAELDARHCRARLAAADVSRFYHGAMLRRHVY